MDQSLEKQKEVQIPIRRNMPLVVSFSTLEQIADAIFTLCLSWFVLERTGSAFITSTIIAIRYIVNVFAGPLIGVFVDRAHPKKAMVKSYIVLAIIGFILIFFYLVLEDFIIVSIMAMVVLNDIAQTFIIPSRRRILPDLVGTERIAVVNGFIASAGQGGALFGKAIGGLLLSVIGIIGVLLTHSVIF
ncbi:MFS transporter [Fervidibacillus albus]|uniref:MFS transporter n=1 Tax=Fervidibacillus albus TaxID=2980026 RepID=A0A9E8LSV3_9BACI|nr:MFS transporter [Fervidibacillus albus]WAA08916.1 MFS transporter [Fervidibacillus albus]